MTHGSYQWKLEGKRRPTILSLAPPLGETEGHAHERNDNREATSSPCICMGGQATSLLSFYPHGPPIAVVIRFIEALRPVSVQSGPRGVCEHESCARVQCLRAWYSTYLSAQRSVSAAGNLDSPLSSACGILRAWNFVNASTTTWPIASNFSSSSRPPRIWTAAGAPW